MVEYLSEAPKDRTCNVGASSIQQLKH